MESSRSEMSSCSLCMLRKPSNLNATEETLASCLVLWLVRKAPSDTFSARSREKALMPMRFLGSARLWWQRMMSAVALMLLAP